MHKSLGGLSHSSYASWVVVFKAPEDERWCIVKDNLGAFGLTHNCKGITPDPRYSPNNVCGYCGDAPPTSLEGFLELVKWEK